jgi:nucleotide sugar dehydrogenase
MNAVITVEPSVQTAQRPTRAETVAVIGLGYVGLPTGLALVDAGFGLVGIDADERRLSEIRAGQVDAAPGDRLRVIDAAHNPRVALAADPRMVATADAVLICVPTPVDETRAPNLSALRSACASVVAHARPGQVVILTSTSHVGATRELLVEPLARRGLIAGGNVSVAFSPERIDPGNALNPQHTVPRVVGGATRACADAAAALLAEISAHTVTVSSLEAAELVKLHENVFRAVNIALANELADVARAHGLDALEIVDAAATKPYGFMPFFPGPGAGGHCIPCDPHYLLAPLDHLGARAPLITEAMRALHARPRRIMRRAVEVLAADGIVVGDARVLVVGVAYKSGIADVRESPGAEVVRSLLALGAEVDYYDPHVAELDGEGRVLRSLGEVAGGAYDLVVVTLTGRLFDLSWIGECRRVLDCTYRLAREWTCELV